jgi:hypothetical protein
MFDYERKMGSCLYPYWKENEIFRPVSYAGLWFVYCVIGIYFIGVGLIYV